MPDPYTLLNRTRIYYKSNSSTRPIFLVRIVTSRVCCWVNLNASRDMVGSTDFLVFTFHDGIQYCGQLNDHPDFHTYVSRSAESNYVLPDLVDLKNGCTNCCSSENFVHLLSHPRCDYANEFSCLVCSFSAIPKKPEKKERYPSLVLMMWLSNT